MHARQLPRGEEIHLDHVAHFVPDMDAAAGALERLGFTLTPFTAQMNQTPNGPVPAGMANRCAMLERGYVEFLTAVSDSPLARRFRQAVSRYTGLHLVALAVADTQAAHARLEAEGFAPEPPVHLRRPVELVTGEQREASFTVLRVPPERMPEGRIQLLAHHTEDAVWQPRWLDHSNAIRSLEAILVAVDDPRETADRFGRFAGRTPRVRDAHRYVLSLDRGRIVFVAGAALREIAPWAPPAPGLPFIAGHALGSADVDATRQSFAAGGVAPAWVDAGETAYVLPPELGGFATLAAPGVVPSWAR